MTGPGRLARTIATVLDSADQDATREIVIRRAPVGITLEVRDLYPTDSRTTSMSIDPDALTRSTVGDELLAVALAILADSHNGLRYPTT